MSDSVLIIGFGIILMGLMFVTGSINTLNETLKKHFHNGGKTNDS